MPHRMNFRSYSVRVLCISLVAFVLRIAGMTTRSLWTDESFTLLRIQGSWADMFTNAVLRQGIPTTDLNPPVYFAALKAWTLVSGDTEFVLRLFSVFFAVLVVPLTAMLGRRLHSASAGLWAALFVATCPASQWYGWEVRNYSIIEAFAPVSLILAAALTDGRMKRLPAIAAWVVVALLGIFTHYTFAGFAAGQLLVIAVAAVAAMRRIEIRRILLWSGIGVITIALMFAGGLGETLLQAVRLHVLPYWTAPRGTVINPLDLLRDIGAAMAFGFRAADPTGVVITIGFLGMAALGLIWLGRRAALMLGAIIGSLGMWWGLAIVIPNQPSFRYFIALVPLLYVASAVTLVVVARHLRKSKARWAGMVVPGMLAALVLLPHAHGLRNTFTPGETAQDDWRSWARYLRDHWRPGDVVVLNLLTPESIVRRYLGDLPIDQLTFEDLQSGRVVGIRSAEDLARKYDRVWVANTGGDFSNVDIARWLPGLTRSDMERFSSRSTILQLELYVLHDNLAGDVSADIDRVSGLSAVRLAGWEILSGNPYHSSTNFQLRAAWMRDAGAGPWREPTNLRVRLQTGDVVWLSAEVPANLQNAPARWGAEGAQVFYETYVIPAPPGLPVQDYVLHLDMAVGDKYEVWQTVTAPVAAEDRDCCLVLAPPAVRDVWTASDAALARVEFPERVRFGARLPLVLSWRRTATSAAPWQTRVSLAPWIGETIAQDEVETGGGNVPITQWPLDGWVREMHTLDVPFDTAPGLYRILLERRRGEQRVDDTMLGMIRIEAYPSSLVPADANMKIAANIGDLALLGLRIPEMRRGETLDLHTHWRVEQKPTRDGVLFLHIHLPDGSAGPQDDNPPERGQRSTLSYGSGDGIDQIHRVTIPADAPAGEYQIYVGIYDVDDQERWPVTQNGVPVQDNLIMVGTFTLKP
jgi:hypothetical protein